MKSKDILRDLIQSVKDSNSPLRSQKKKLKEILKDCCLILTRNENFPFKDVFSSIVFLSQKYKLSQRTEWLLHNLYYSKTEMTSNELLRYCTALEELLDASDNQIPSQSKPTGTKHQTEESFIEKERVIILEIDRETRVLTCCRKSDMETILIKLGVRYVNDQFDETFSNLWVGAEVNIIAATIDNDGKYFIPKMIVLEPDFLIDASSFAECMHGFCSSPMLYLMNLCNIRSSSLPLLKGNLANYFLDELIFSEDQSAVSFNDIFKESFRYYPIEYTASKELEHPDGFIDFKNKLFEQFENIKRTIREDFPKRGIDTSKVILEPAFFSEKYGFQGRLDVLCRIFEENDRSTTIVELKSGKIPDSRYDPYGIKKEHMVQLTVYWLIIESVYGLDKRNINNYVLYSDANEGQENFRFSPKTDNFIKALIDMRNRIVAIDHRLRVGDNVETEHFFRELYKMSDSDSKLPSFFKKRIEDIVKPIFSSSPLLKQYFFRFFRFAITEIYLLKVGKLEYGTSRGVAALWNTDFSEREEACDALGNLRIKSIDYSERHMEILFLRKNDDDQIVNFRKGDICILYSKKNAEDTPLNRQILKGNILSISQKEVRLLFRYKQKNIDFFSKNEEWAIEHDFLDSGIKSIIENLNIFISLDSDKRDVILGSKAPHMAFMPSPEMDNLNAIVERAMSVDDYFLIVGPPGTGKTSQYAKRMIHDYYYHTDKVLLIAAYTNRAVDELCEAIEQALSESDPDKKHDYIRIGSKLSCHEPYKPRLIQNICAIQKSRAAIREKLKSTRIIVGTVASLNGKTDLFDLMNFDVAIIDEASQILEPSVLKILSKIKKFIFIGDHKQLSTIVAQSDSEISIEDPLLRNIELNRCDRSLFERLMNLCLKNSWTGVHTLLTKQGRMHEDIAAFPSKMFYDGKLKSIDSWQKEKLLLTTKSKNLYAKAMASSRLLFFSTEKMCRKNQESKTNQFEADTVVRCIAAAIELYKENGASLQGKQIGVITSFRNQIALIVHKLASESIDIDTENIMVDTVERFQGSQRDIIIVSFCINNPLQLEFLTKNQMDGGVDRKLNVALTRARKHLILIGNRHILSTNELYEQLIEDSSRFIIDDFS